MSILNVQYKNFAKAAQYEIDNRMGVNIPIESILDLVKNGKNRDFYLEEIDGYYYDTSEYGLDTYPREVIMEDIGIYFTGMSWPTYGDSKEYRDKFFEKFRKATKNIGE